MQLKIFIGIVATRKVLQVFLEIFYHFLILTNIMIESNKFFFNLMVKNLEVLEGLQIISKDSNADFSKYYRIPIQLFKRFLITLLSLQHRYHLQYLAGLQNSGRVRYTFLKQRISNIVQNYDPNRRFQILNSIAYIVSI